MLTISKECKDIEEATEWIRKLEKRSDFKNFKIYLKYSRSKRCYITKIVGNIDL